jgi:hypothetical protein
MFKVILFFQFLIFPFLANAQTCWQKTIMNDSVFVIQKKYDIINDTMCVIVIKEDGLDCLTLQKIKNMKQNELDNFIDILIAKGFRVEIYRKKEIFN